MGHQTHISAPTHDNPPLCFLLPLSWPYEPVDAYDTNNPYAHTSPTMCSRTLTHGCNGIHGQHPTPPQTDHRRTNHALKHWTSYGFYLSCCMAITVLGWQTHLTQLGQSELHPPDLRLASQAELSAKLQLLVQALLLERPAGGLDRRAVCRAQQTGKSAYHAHFLTALSTTPCPATHSSA